jgi:hypothetical protein
MFELCARTYDPTDKAALRLVQGIFRTFTAAPWRAWRDCGGGVQRAFSSQVESLGGSENAIKQRPGAFPENQGEREMLESEGEAHGGI